MKKRSFILALAIALSLLSGCAQKETPAPAAKDPTPTAGSSEQTSAPAAVTYKDKVVIGVNAKTTTTNPTAVSNVAHNIMFNLTHNSLSGYDETTGTVVPELATEWVLGEDNKTWTFTLRDDVYFHNGEKMTAKDVVFTFEYGKEAENGTVKSFYRGIESVTAIDDTHVKIVTAAPDMDFIYTLSTPSMCILSEAAIKADPENGTAIGTGPYMNKEFVVGDHTLLERFDKYWGEAPYTKYLDFRYISEGSARLIALENGEIDVCQAPNNTELELIQSNKKLALETYQASALTYLALNMDSVLGEDENLRLAIAYALKVQDIIDGAASGFAGKANGMWGFFQFGYFDDWASVGQSDYTFDLEKAKDYMAKSKHPDGLTLTFTTSTTWRVNALQIIQQQLAPLNINVVIDEVDAAGLTSKADSGDYEVIMYSVTFKASASDAKNIYLPGRAANHAKYNNARVNELFELASAEPSETKRAEYYKEIQTIVHAECPYIPLYYANSGVAYNNAVEGAVYNISGAHDYTYIRIPA